MPPKLDRGRLVRPDSVRHAHERLRTLDHEIGDIDAQLADGTRRQRYSSTAEWLSWRRSAEAAQKLYRSEREQLQAWLDTADHPLFRQAYDLLRLLREEDCDLDPHELELISKLDEHFK